MWPGKKKTGCVTELFLELEGVEAKLPVKFDSNISLEKCKNRIRHHDSGSLLPPVYPYKLLCKNIEPSDAVRALHCIVDCFFLSSDANITITGSNHGGSSKKRIIGGRKDETSWGHCCGTLPRKSIQFAKLTAPKLDRFRNPDRFDRISNALHLYFIGLMSPADAALVLFVAALEGLFVQATQELSHRLALAIACYLENGDPKAKYQLYKQVKMIYTYRSKVVHGDKIHKDEEQAAITLVDSLVPKAEELARRCLCKVFERNHHEFICNTNKLDDFFTVMTVGYSPDEALRRIRAGM
jgi:Apea-like HEPN